MVESSYVLRYTPDDLRVRIDTAQDVRTSESINVSRSPTMMQIECCRPCLVGVLRLQRPLDLQMLQRGLSSRPEVAKRPQCPLVS